MKKSLFSFFAVALFAVFTPSMALAMQVDAGKTVSIPASQLVADNAYLAGGQVTFSTTAQKDLTVAGGQITINGPVWGDALLAGGTLQILQPVKGDLRAVGGQITITQSVSGDVAVAGGTIQILPGAVIGGDVLVGGGVVTIEGTVNGKVTIYGGEVTINGVVAGPVTIKAGESVTFGEKTVFGSTLDYSAPQEATVATGAKLGDKVTFTQEEKRFPEGRDVAGVVMAIVGFLIFAKFVGILVAALALVWIFKTSVQTITDKTLANFWKKVGIGFIALVVAPVAIFLLAITVVGLYLAFFVGILYLFALVLAGVYMGVLAGAILAQWIKKTPIVDWKWTVLGTLAVFILGFVPVIGWIADLVLFLAALGAVTMSMRRDAEAKM